MFEEQPTKVSLSDNTPNYAKLKVYLIYLVTVLDVLV